MFSDNVSIQVAADENPRGCSLEAAKVDAGALQPRVAGIGGSLQENGKAPQSFYAREFTSKGEAPGNSDASSKHDAQAIASFFCQLFQEGKRGGEQKRIPTFQVWQPLALNPVPGRGERMFCQGYLFSRSESDGWGDAFQPSSGHQRFGEVLPDFAKAERLVFAGDLRGQTQAVAKDGQGHWLGFWFEEFDCGQRGEAGGESPAFEFLTSQAGDSAKALRQEGEGQPSAEQGMSFGGEDSRADCEPAPGLFAQGGTALCQQFRHYLHRGFECVKDGKRGLVSAVNHGRFVVNVASTIGSQSRKSWPDNSCRSTAFYESKVLKMRGVGSEVVERSHPHLPALRVCGRPGCERGKKYTTGWDAAFSEGSQL